MTIHHSSRPDISDSQASSARGGETTSTSRPLDPEAYCRELEAYLCRKNDGHLIRIVGPAFEQVCGWAARGVPLKTAMHGVDRYFERYYAKGPRRRPVRIEFCEADVLDAFDEWRRAVGVRSIVQTDEEEATSGGAAAPATGGLRLHLERVVARLTACRGGADSRLDAAIAAIVAELDGLRTQAKTVRGHARELLLDRLSELDAQLIDLVRAQSDEVTLDYCAAEADEELRPFRHRMPAEAYEQSRRACIDRLLRDRAKLPVIAYG